MEASAEKSLVSIRSLGSRMERRTLVVGPGAPAKELEDAEPAGVLGLGGAERLDVRSLEQLGEDVGVWCADGLGDQV